MAAREDMEVFWAEKVVAKRRKLVYNVWTYRRFAKKRYGMSGGYLNDYALLKTSSGTPDYHQVVR